MAKQKTSENSRLGSDTRSFIFVHPHLHIGGAETQSVMLANELATRGHRVRFIFHNRTGELLPRLNPRIETYSLGTDSHAALPLLILKLKRTLKKIEPSLVIVKLWSAMFTTYFATRTGTQHKIVMYEDLDPAEHWKEMKFGRVKVKLAGHIYRKSKNVTANTQTVANHMQRVYGLTNRPRVFYGAVDSAKIYQRACESLPDSNVEANNESFQITTIASLHRRKGHLDCLAALEHVGLDWVWHVIGEGPELATLKKEIPAQLRNRVVLHGAMENPMPLLKRSDLLLHLSHSEAFGLVLLEALVLGIPIVSSKTIGALEIKETLRVPDQQMVLVDRRNEEEVARTIETLVKKKPQLTGREQKLLEVFSIEETADKWIEAFDAFR